MQENKLIIIISLLICAALSSGCLGEGGTNISITGNDTEIEIHIPDTLEAESCQVGTQVQVKNPTSGMTLDMTIVGTEEFEGETLCKAALKAGEEDGEAKFEYLWSKNKNTSVWRSYDSEGNLSGKVIRKDGKMTIVDGQGHVIEFRKE